MKSNNVQDLSAAPVLLRHDDVENIETDRLNDLTIGWQNLNPLSHPKCNTSTTSKASKGSGDNLNYVTLAPKARLSGEILN